MAAKKRRRKPGLLWRVLFGHNGPTKVELKKLLRLSFSNTFPVQERDALTGRVRTRYMRIEADGKIREVKAPAKKKRTAAKKATGRRTASQPSEPSRASKTGSAQRRRQTVATPAARRGRPEPMTDRVLRNTDGTFNGSRTADPAKALKKAEQEYVKALRNANTAGRRAEELLGWQKPRRR